MKDERKIKLILTRQPITEGAGVHLNRLFGHNEAPTLDPFLLLDDFRSDKPEDYLQGFPWHPHRGIETITYVLKGDVEHGDSLGNRGVISSGDVQWMTAGSGIIHQEMPKGDAQGAMHGFQLWANLPASQKMMAPKYRDITAGQVPEVEVGNGICIKVIAGNIAGVQGPMDDIVIDPEYFDCSVPVGETFVHKTDPGYTAFVYVIAGKGETDGTDVENGTLVLFDQGEQLSVKALDESLRFLLLTGKPLAEPVAWQGPIVMNSQAELTTAFLEYQDGTFIKNR
ncbi:pirin family protein [Desulfotalea psychrophila]|uniref:Related to pirin n=1 Tax=Desulfotalea psychrophila (strain LSv54 / DSM 12343) TaxID=177439 RepID=Q6ANQ8_DESPS|nr:pirin family protein [Desulfotalea psychrophila]CAG36016.1 related to pirin [Desulfotalea psychrophila LSv54]